MHSSVTVQLNPSNAVVPSTRLYSGRDPAPGRGRRCGRHCGGACAYAPVAYADFLSAAHLTSARESYAEQWRRRVQETQRLTLVAALDGLVIGFIRFGRGEFAPSAEAGALEFIYLAPEFWDQGMGKQMLAAAEAGLAGMGFASAYLAVYEANQRARTFYERNGWAFDGARWEVDRGGPVAQIRYVKDLKVTAAK